MDWPHHHRLLPTRPRSVRVVSSPGRQKISAENAELRTEKTTTQKSAFGKSFQKAGERLTDSQARNLHRGRQIWHTGGPQYSPRYMTSGLPSAARGGPIR